LDTLSPKVSPRAGHEGLPSPRQAQEQDAIKKETLDQAALIQQMNSKLERLVLENKRLEAAVLGTLPRAIKKEKSQRKMKSDKEGTDQNKERSSHLVIDNLRQMEALSRLAERDLHKLGADDSI
jgi:hypothetical protein